MAELPRPSSRPYGSEPAPARLQVIADVPDPSDTAADVTISVEHNERPTIVLRVMPGVEWHIDMDAAVAAYVSGGLAAASGVRFG